MARSAQPTPPERAHLSTGPEMRAQGRRKRQGGLRIGGTGRQTPQRDPACACDSEEEAKARSYV